MAVIVVAIVAIVTMVVIVVHIAARELSRWSKIKGP
jgi:hypothetical protein